MGTCATVPPILVTEPAELALTIFEMGPSTINNLLRLPGEGRKVLKGGGAENPTSLIHPQDTVGVWP